MLNYVIAMSVVATFFGGGSVKQIHTGINPDDLNSADDYVSRSTNFKPTNEFVKCAEVRGARYCSSIVGFEVRKFYPPQWDSTIYVGYLISFNLKAAKKEGISCEVSYQQSGELSHFPGDFFSDRVEQLEYINRELEQLSSHTAILPNEFYSAPASFYTLSLSPNAQCFLEVMGDDLFRQYFMPSADGTRIILKRHLQPQVLAKTMGD